MFGLFRRPSPEEQERTRLDALLKNSRSIEGILTDTSESLLFFTYEVRGVTYHAAQDVSMIEGADALAIDPQPGPVTVRYSNSNPANSMVMSKNWSGFKRNEIKGANSYDEPHA